MRRLTTWPLLFAGEDTEVLAVVHQVVAPLLRTRWVGTLAVEPPTHVVPLVVVMPPEVVVVLGIGDPVLARCDWLGEQEDCDQGHEKKSLVLFAHSKYII